MADPTSTKPYLLRALYEWCVDNGFTPYLSVVVDDQTHVPMEYQFHYLLGVRHSP